MGKVIGIDLGHHEFVRRRNGWQDKRKSSENAEGNAGTTTVDRRL